MASDGLWWPLMASLMTSDDLTDGHPHQVHAVRLEVDLARRREESASDLPPPLHPDKCMLIESSDWETIKAIACTPSAVSDYDGVATMTLRTFFEIGLRAGAAIGLDDGDGVAEAPPPLASPKPRAVVVSTEVPLMTTDCI